VPFGVLFFVAISYALSCPPDRPQCDLPDMTAVAVSFVLSPLSSAMMATLVFRWLSASVRLQEVRQL
jgi:hypothetical protein